MLYISYIVPGYYVLLS